MNINVEILKCHHGVSKIGHCEKCEEEKRQTQSYKLNYFNELREKPKRIPIYRGCHAASNGGCFCTGACKEIIAYRDPIPGEIV